MVPRAVRIRVGPCADPVPAPWEGGWEKIKLLSFLELLLLEPVGSKLWAVAGLFGHFPFGSPLDPPFNFKIRGGVG